MYLTEEHLEQVLREIKSLNERLAKLEGKPAKEIPVIEVEGLKPMGKQKKVKK